jgi:hypothetical protein
MRARTHWYSNISKFVDSPYYSESELCGGAVTVSFSKYLPWQAMHFLQRPTHFSKTCCRPLITSKFLASELPFHGWKSPENAWGENWILCSARKKWIVERSVSIAKGEALRKKGDRHRTSTKFQLGVIRWVHELCKRPSYIFQHATRWSEFRDIPFNCQFIEAF